MAKRFDQSSFSSSASSWLSSFLDQADLPVIHLPREESSASESTSTGEEDESVVAKPLMKRGTSDSSGAIISGETSSSGYGSSTGLASSRESSYRSNGMDSRQSSYASTGLVSRTSTYYAANEKGSSSSSSGEDDSESGSSDASSSTDGLQHQSMDDPSTRTDPRGHQVANDSSETPSTSTPTLSVETQKTTNTTNASVVDTAEVHESIAEQALAFDEPRRKISENSDGLGFAKFVSLIKTGDIAAAFDAWTNAGPGSTSDDSNKSIPSGNGETTKDPPRNQLSSSLKDVWKNLLSPSQAPDLPISAPASNSPLGVPTTPTKKTSVWRSSSSTIGNLATIQEEASIAGDEFVDATTPIRPTDRRYQALGAPPSQYSRFKRRRRCVSSFGILVLLGALVAIIVLLLVPTLRELMRRRTTSAVNSPDGTVQPSIAPIMMPTRQTLSRSPVSIGEYPASPTSAPTTGITPPAILESEKLPTSMTSSPSSGSPSDSTRIPSLIQPFLSSPISMPPPSTSSGLPNQTSAPVPRAGGKDETTFMPSSQLSILMPTVLIPMESWSTSSPPNSSPSESTEPPSVYPPFLFPTITIPSPSSASAPLPLAEEKAVTFMPSSQSSTLMPSVLIAIEPMTIQAGPSPTPTSTPIEAPSVRPAVPTTPPSSFIPEVSTLFLQPTNFFVAPISALPQQTAGPSVVSLAVSAGPSQDPEILETTVGVSPSPSQQWMPSSAPIISDVVKASDGWLLLGNEIMGIATVQSKSSTSTVCLSSNGDIAAVADEFGVRVLSVKTGNWIQMGQTLPGVVSALSLSGDGQTMACAYLVGDTSSNRVEIFRFTGQQWTKFGQELPGNCEFKNSISLSYDGAVVAIGSPLERNAAGFITVHRYDLAQGFWIQVGGSILGDSSNDYAGVARLNDDGTRLLVGYPGHSTSTQLNTGLARVFKMEQNSWQQVGQDLVGNAKLKQLGYAVAISSSGNYIAVSAPYSNPLELKGQVFVYMLSPSGMWEQMGPTIQDAIAVYSDEAGRSLAISGDGMTVCLGSPRAQSVRVLTFSVEFNTWEEIGFLISERRAFGISVALSSDGKTLAMGSGHELGSKSAVSIFYRNATSETLDIFYA